MSSGKWITPEQRKTILDGNAAGRAVRKIAADAKVSANTVYREVAKYARGKRLEERKTAQSQSKLSELAKLALEIQAALGE